MEINSHKSYKNIIYSAIVVNDDIDSDPMGLGRVQLYIPSEHLEFASTYTEYMMHKDKQSQRGWEYFPWAKTLVSDLKVGNYVYGSMINNQSNEYIVLGLDVNNSANIKGVGSGLEYSGDVSGILDLAMPIIIHNEVGISPSDWPNNIPHNRYISINPYDNGGWSIGLIQWHHCRAFDCLYQIAKADDNWESCWANKELDLYKDLKKSVNNNSTAGYRTKYQDTFHPTAGTELYKSIQNMLGSEQGKKTQRIYASDDTASSIETLMGEPYNIKNPAIIIFLADIMNQYGPGLPSTIKKAASISGGGGDTMSQLNEFRNWCKGNLGSYNTYISRRNKTYTYIENLNNTGKLHTVNIIMTDMEGADKGGKLLWPVPTCTYITSEYGNRRYYNNKQKRWVENFHTGIDLAKSGDSTGEPIIAAHSGTISTQTTSGGYGILTKITNGEMTTYYAHQVRRVEGIKDGVTVKAGQTIGYVGDTGNSDGAHLHFEVRINNQHRNPKPYIKK